ncbi:MAG: HK97 gp10 family phage protein [Thermodesulfobacteriota bacterium]|nr:MAG: HK97 gp10 family phage protein [Thermodesulfobacteriota bacterium]
MDIKFHLDPDPRQIAQKLKKDIADVIQSGLLRVAGAIEAEAVAVVPRRTSNLANSIRKYLTGRNSAVVTATTPYAVFVHEGTGMYGPEKRPFDIRPKDKQALAFTWMGKKIVVKKVTIKGQKPQKFFEQAVRKVQPRFQEIFLGGVKFD